MKTERSHFSVLQGGEPDGCISSDTRVFGTYLHGIFDDDAFRHAFLTAARAFYALASASHFENWKQKREESFDRLAKIVQESLDLERIFGMIGLPYKPHKQQPGQTIARRYR